MIDTVTNSKNLSSASFSDVIPLEDELFHLLSELIYSKSGISLQKSKKYLISSRLYRRMLDLGIESYEEYYNLITDIYNGSDELVEFLNLMTTNKTDFFREADHYEILKNSVVPKLSKRLKKISVWSAGCSTGEEPYTIAMVLESCISQKTTFDYNVTGTDICTDAISHAQRAVYTSERGETIPDHIKNRFMLKGKGTMDGMIKIAPEIYDKVSFNYHNLYTDDFSSMAMFDVIFCRNVFIYFDKKTQSEIYGKFYQKLKPGGYLFVGHSESLNNYNFNYKYIAPGFYQKEGQ